SVVGEELGHELVLGAGVAGEVMKMASLPCRAAGCSQANHLAEGRGEYRVRYRINDEGHEIVVLHIDHRRDAYRS
ncbi:MAG: type II toxin-antitoxin system RelE family toxin, partial [Candidatus Dormibacteraceae bacterium]